jgi:hypothetical protein
MDRHTSVPEKGFDHRGVALLGGAYQPVTSSESFGKADRLGDSLASDGPSRLYEERFARLDA